MYIRIREILIATTLLSASAASQALVIESAAFVTQTLYDCGSDGICFNSDGSDTQVERVGNGGVAQGSSLLGSNGSVSGVSLGYDGENFTPTTSIYANTTGNARFTTGALGFQKYTFTEAGTISITGTFTGSQTGQSDTPNEDPRGLLNASFFAFQTDDSVFDTGNCGFPFEIDFDLSFAGLALYQCLDVGFYDGLTSFSQSFFDVGESPVAGGEFTSTLDVSGEIGDVFYLGTNVSARAHLGGFADSANTLRVAFGDDSPGVEAAFATTTFTSAPTLVPTPGPLGLFLAGLIAALGRQRTRSKGRAQLR